MPRDLFRFSGLSQRLPWRSRPTGRRVNFASNLLPRHADSVNNTKTTESNKSRPRRGGTTSEVALFAYTLAGLGILLLTYDSAITLPSAAPSESFRAMQRILCHDYLHPTNPVVSPASSASRSLWSSSIVERSESRYSPFAPLPGTSDPAQQGSIWFRQQQSRETTYTNKPRSNDRSADPTLLHRLLSCSQSFDNCTERTADPDCKPPADEDTKYERYQIEDHVADWTAALPGGMDNVAYVVPVPECPPHPDEVAIESGGLSSADSATFYDAYSVVKAAVCNCTNNNNVTSDNTTDTTAPISDYNYTMYAIVHTDAAACVGADGTQYDLVKALQEMGYYVEVFDEAVYAGEMTSSPYIAQNVDMRSMVAAHAYRLTNHPLAVVLDVTTVMLQPVDELYNALLSDSTVKAAYNLDPTGGTIDTGMLVIKPSVEEFQSVRDGFLNTAYDVATGWGGTGIGAGGGDGAGLSGFLAYYYARGDGTANPALELDRCTYNNGNDPACKTSAIGDVKIARTSDVCGRPWDCTYDATGWDAETEALCQDILREWSRKRADYEDNHWAKSDKVARTGTYQSDVFLGYCDGAGGKGGYKKMLGFETLPVPAPTPPAPVPAPTSVPTPIPGGVPYIPVPEYLLVTCPVMDCGPGSYVKNDCTCTDPSAPCDACPFGTRCQAIEGYPLMCIDCSCGFCNYEDRPCCDFNGVNNCKSATNDNECLLQNGFFGPFDGTGSACSGVEISYTATPNGCGCQPSQTEPCTYNPNDRSMDDQCYVCSADDLVIAAGSGDACWECKVCLNNCEACILSAATVLEMETCLNSQEMNKKNANPECREGCASVCGK